MVAATLHGADEGDTLDETLRQAGIGSGEGNQTEAEQRPEQNPKVNPPGVEELIADRRSKLSQRRSAGADEGLRSAYLYSREKQKGRRHWQGKGEQQQVVYQNRERVRGENGKSLVRRRGEFVERRFLHCYETDARGNER